MADFHATWGVVVILVVVAYGVVQLVSRLAPSLRWTHALWVAALGVVAIQGLSGIAAAIGRAPSEVLHWVYGIALGAVLLIGRGLVPSFSGWGSAAVALSFFAAASALLWRLFSTG